MPRASSRAGVHGTKLSRALRRRGRAVRRRRALRNGRPSKGSARRRASARRAVPDRARCRA
ncbi:MAG: hypothetical protein C0483_01310 [Pirellula sp.]|nr:hypothetical protein [Pirellula sp.]